MKAYVCMKHVPDTAANIKIIGGKQIDESVKFIISPHDEYAIEEAVRLVEKQGGEVILVTVAKEAAMTTIRAALALGPHRAILVKVDQTFLDSQDTARILAKVIQDDGPADIIFAGKQAMDTEGMQTCYRLATALSMPVVTDVVRFATTGDKVTVEREIGGGEKEVIEMTMPCVVGATKGLNEPRFPKLPDVMKAKKKDVKLIDLKSLNLELGQAVQILQLEPVPERSKAKIIGGSTKDAVRELVRILREEEKVLD
jgi:electron transfer flavoprotein beta subunit